MRRLEVITGTGRRRRFSADEKARVVEETLHRGGGLGGRVGTGSRRSKCSHGDDKRVSLHLRALMRKHRSSYRRWWIRRWNRPGSAGTGSAGRQKQAPADRLARFVLEQFFLPALPRCNTVFPAQIEGHQGRA